MSHETVASSGPSLSEFFAGKLAGIAFEDLPAKAREIAINDLIDMAGLCIAARRQDYMQRLVAGVDGSGDCTALGQSRNLDGGGAALVKRRGHHRRRLRRHPGRRAHPGGVHGHPRRPGGLRAVWRQRPGFPVGHHHRPGSHLPAEPRGGRENP